MHSAHHMCMLRPVTLRLSDRGATKQMEEMGTHNTFTQAHVDCSPGSGWDCMSFAMVAYARSISNLAKELAFKPQFAKPLVPCTPLCDEDSGARLRFVDKFESRVYSCRNSLKVHVPIAMPILESRISKYG
jgi:hypothetical protein